MSMRVIGATSISKVCMTDFYTWRNMTQYSDMLPSSACFITSHKQLECPELTVW